MEYAAIQQKVNCVFGDDHLITAEIGPNNTLQNLRSTCGNDAKEETEGLILLGTDPMKTCIGYMKAFIEHINSDQKYGGISHPDEYRGTVLQIIGKTIQSQILKKKATRAAEANKYKADKAAEATSGYVCSMFKDHADGALGSAGRGLIFTKHPDNSYTASVVTKSQSYNYTTKKHEGVPEFVVADRVKGEWVIRRGALYEGSRAFETLDWGGQCVHCRAKGNRHHNGSVKHFKTLTKNVLIALQATSAEGVRLTKSGVTDKNGEPIRFTYRANMKPEKLIGVRFAPEY